MADESSLLAFGLLLIVLYGFGLDNKAVFVEPASTGVDGESFF